MANQRVKISFISKNSLVGIEYWLTYNVSNKIQPQEYSRGGDMDDILYSTVCVLDDKRHVPYLYRDADDRNLNLNWFDNDWDDVYCFAGVRNSLLFSLNHLREFCFVSCPFQLPNILLNFCQIFLM